MFKILKIFELLELKKKTMACACGKSVRRGKATGCRVRYCICGSCNHCHISGLCPNALTWYHQKGTNGFQRKRELLESHGEHGWVPGCNNCN